MTDPPRSGVGLFSRRKDIAALTIVFCFGALMNAFGMVSPVYELESWLGRLLHVNREAPVLGLIFAVFLVVEPAILLGLATWATRALAGVQLAPLKLLTRYTYAFVPLGFGMWLAHYGFHFFSGLYTIIPVTQNALASLGLRVTPQWTLTGLPGYIVQPLEFGFLLLGLAGSLLVAWRLAAEDSPDHSFRAFAPWAVVALLLWCASLWLMTQPMEMRAMIMAG